MHQYMPVSKNIPQQSDMTSPMHNSRMATVVGNNTEGVNRSEKNSLSKKASIADSSQLLSQEL